eukprot:1157097-Pelagomonas_calceolata.AAC.4
MKALATPSKHSFRDSWCHPKIVDLGMQGKYGAIIGMFALYMRFHACAVHTLPHSRGSRQSKSTP